MSENKAKDLVVYEFEGVKFTPRPGPDNESRFDADEVAAVIGSGTSGGRSIARMVDDDEKGVHIVDTPGGPQKCVYLTEAGLYHSLIASRSKRAKPFRRYVTHEVLPAIRKHGFYVDMRQAEKVPETVRKEWGRVYFKDGLGYLDLEPQPLTIESVREAHKYPEWRRELDRLGYPKWNNPADRLKPLN